MGKDGFMNLLFTHKEFPAAPPNVIFLLLHKTMFPWQEGYTLHATAVQKKFKSAVFGLSVMAAHKGWAGLEGLCVFCFCFFSLNVAQVSTLAQGRID